MSIGAGGVAGTNDGSFFKAPRWVDQEKAPGMTRQVLSTWSALAWNVATCRHLIYSPNLVWFSITLLVYVVFPYDMALAQVLDGGWVRARLFVNFGVVSSYYLFWHTTLYRLGWGQRKFMPDNWPSPINMLHNLWYTFLGVLVWTAFEVCVVHGYATGRLPYISDGEAFATAGNTARMLIYTLLVPIWRSVHFYFSHRLIHARPLYKFVHSLHHRNTDIEPFAGLCMHPVEHMWYLSCIAPSLYLLGSPVHFLFNGMHLLLSPAASHSGFEDHMQSDQFHYLHHAYFGCNYGSAGVPLDRLFGTFRDKLTAERRGKTTETKLTGMPSSANLVYNFFTFGVFLTLYSGLTQSAMAHLYPRSVAALAAFGPAAFAVALWAALFRERSSLNLQVAELGKFSFHLVVGFLVGVLPVYHTLLLGLLPPA
eukprot:NODE_6947_length_1622_cov_14.913712.p1 GENE.NODE_6947_length_1622_cov_14.913712~~NODE_6947_length_1622_cov_14.913712.p1  ORF type:complete len:424 (+),score=60.42 NODE_6947_length_1622_cov_14.913712:99-1370(+)